ncbi:WD domain-containing protein [Plectosphaerella plurivora]|uniref:WD domain-containing protein n=1 Tax=Plectosphaerella plurivora TaxID=936078 RepID=A0A9P8VI64_9PEZI|nr:WD domain-containing protein [Plectosphaerella plurivora]
MAGHSQRRDMVLAPITALAFYTSPSGQQYLLVGEDTDIKVFEATTSGTGRLCCQFRVFSVQSIHGIRVRQGDEYTTAILVWGSQNVAVLPGLFLQDRLSTREASPRVPETRAPDWIFDGILAQDDDDRCFLVSAHNEVLEVTWEGQAQERDPYALRFGRVIYPARPALYSARVAWAAGGELLVAGGTVFGEIMVWKCAVETGVASLVFVFTGHEGSIFGVDFSPELERPDGSKGRLLASCSDDRTVRIWDVSDTAAGGVAVGYGDEARETGFVGIDAATVSAVQDRTGASVAVGMGHVSRIWNVRFGGLMNAQQNDSKLAMAVYTFGEDATVWKWELSIDRPAWEQQIAQAASSPASGAELAALTHRETFSNHDGKHIWACDLQQRVEDGNATTLVATGGADGRVNIIADSEATSSNKTAEPLRQLETVVIRDLLDRLSTSPPQGGKRKKVTLHQFVYIAHDRILGISNTGQLVLGTAGHETTWEAVPLGDIEPSALAVSTVMRTPAPGLGLIGTTQKKLYLYRDGAIQEMGTLSGKIADLFVVDGIGPGDPRYHQDEAALKTVNILVVLIGAQEAMQLVTLDLDTSIVTSTMTVPDQELNYIATSARMLTPDVLAIGSRHGHVTLFKKSDTNLTAITHVDRRTEDTITSISPLPDQTNTPFEAPFLFLTTSRDGYYRLYQVHAPSEVKTTFTLLHETTSTATVALEDAWFTSHSPSELILAGFRGKRFIIYNTARRLELAAVDCSGQHRSFTYRALSSNDPSALRFTFNRASDLGLHTQRGVGFVTPKHGTHGREIRAVAPGARWIATGAEDTVIRLWEYSDGTQGIDGTARCVAAVKLHTAGLQALRWAPTTHDGERLFSCAGNEEFVVWHVRDGGATSFPGPAVVKEAVFADKTPEGDLRIMDFDIAAVTDDDNDFSCLISMAFSNSTVKTYTYSTATGFSLVATARYTGACITKVELLRDEDGMLEIVTAASDGHIAVWEAQLHSGHVVEYVPRLFVRVHQNGIKAFGLRREEDRRITVFTGGDDNALVITSLVMTAEDGWKLDSRRGVKRAHAAAVNGIAVLPGVASGSTTIATVSNDQRVKVWRIQDEGISLLGDRNSAVADPGDIAIVGSPAEGAARIMVVGVGMEVWLFEHGKPEVLSRIVDEEVAA